MDPSHAEQQEEVQPPEGDVTEEPIENPSITTHVDENPGTRRVCDLPEKGSWSCWEDDGHCSTSCGNGTQLRRRRCNNPAPTNGGETCLGDILNKVHCHTKECPVYKWGHLKELNLTQNDLKDIMKDEINEMKNNLTIDSKNISATIRKRISARDDRLSAASVGYVGVALLVIPLVMIIVVDAPRVFAVVATIYRKVCSRKSAQLANAQ
ncbi:netrin receptor UNC5A-like isoform X1 [Mytilus edulis]|uniref:netrin receptor UNC5A-like isoform X1 n=1 Tax=Mytilus edulis TaxID=6550 RepID=UPI0039F0DAC3